MSRKNSDNEIRAFKRIFIILSTILVVIITYSIIFKTLGEPEIKQIRSESFANVRIYFDGGVNKKYTSGKVEHLKEFYVSYPPFYSRSLTCYPLPNNSEIFSFNGNIINYTTIGDKICWKGKIDHIIVKYHENLKIENVVLSIREDNVTRIKIFDPYTFGIKVDLIANLKKAYGNRSVEIYKGDFLLTTANGNFYDSVMLTPFSYIEYTFKPV